MSGQINSSSKFTALFKQPPFVGIIAFMGVLVVMPLGHIVMILMEKLVHSGAQWYSPFVDASLAAPNGHKNFSIIDTSVYISAVLMGLIGIIVILWGVRKNTETAGTWAGFAGASLLWTGWVEFSLHFHARYFGVKALCANGEYAFTCAENPATKPEYFMMQGSVGFLLVIMLYFVLNKETRCNMFRWMHKHMHIKVGKPSKGLTRNFANNVAIETLMILWFFYVYLMFLYDETIFGERHWVTYASLAFFAVWSIYLISRLIRFKRVSSALRYAIPTAIIFWNTIEIAGRWALFEEFWIKPLEYKIPALLTLLAVIGFALISIKTARDKTKQIDPH